MERLTVVLLGTGLAALAASVDVNESGKKYQLPITQPVVIDNCFYRDMRYFPTMLLVLPSHEESLVACQQRCITVEGCRYISWWGTGHCVLSGADAYLVEDVFAMAGPVHCTPVLASCRERPSSSFPGATGIESAKAWPSGYVPFPMECWPRSGSVLKHCGKEEVIQDVSSGLVGACQNMEQLTVPLYETCHSLCSKKNFCSIYVENQTGCFIGEMTAGLNCFSPLRNPEAAYHAGRLMHGAVRVLQDLRDTQVFGLTQVFLERDCPGNPRSSCVEYCRLSCYSSLQCNFWQYYLGSGCWVDEGNVLHPLTNAQLRRGWDVAIAGEYIQHFCPGLGWTPAKEWTMTARDTICSKSSKVKELSHVSSVLGCQAQAQRNEDCGKTTFTNGTACFCLRPGGLCEREHFIGFDLYERKDLVEAVQPAAHASLFKAPEGLGAFHVEITLRGVSYERIVASKSASDELRRSFALDVAEATGVSSSSVWNDQGDTREVSLARSSGNGDDSLSIKFNMQLPGHGSADTVTRDLNSITFQAGLRDSVQAAAPDSITGPVEVFTAFGDQEPGIPFSRVWIPLLLGVLVCSAVVFCFIYGLQRHGPNGICMDEDFNCRDPLDGFCDTDSGDEKMRSPKSLRQKRWFRPQSRNVTTA